MDFLDDATGPHHQASDCEHALFIQKRENGPGGNPEATGATVSVSIGQTAPGLRPRAQDCPADTWHRNNLWKIGGRAVQRLGDMTPTQQTCKGGTPTPVDPEGRAMNQRASFPRFKIL